MALSGSLTTSAYEGRYYKLSWTATQNITNNQSTISWTLEALGGSASWYAERTLTVVVAGSTVYSKTDRVARYKGVIATGTKVVNHNSAGAASFSASVKAAVYTSTINCTGSSSFTLDTIPRKSSISVSNGTLGVSQKITVTRLSTSFTHTITAVCGSASTTICTKSTSTSIDFTPPILWAAQNTTGTTVPVTYTITTYNGDTSIGSASITVNCTIPASIIPVCSLEVNDSKGYDLSYGGCIKGVSTLSVKITPVSSYGSEIAAYSTTIDSDTYAESSFISGILSTVGSVAVTSKVTDKRGRVGTASTTVTVLDYSPPVITKLNVARCDSDGTANDQGAYVKVTYSFSVTSLNNKNSMSYTIKYKKSTDSTYSTPNYIASTSYEVTDETVIFEADTGSSYDVLMEVTDAFNTTSKKTSASTASTIMHFKADGTGMGIGKVAELQNVLDIAWVALLRNNQIIDNNKFLFGTAADGSYLSMVGINANNYMYYGQGSYSNSIGRTIVSGNELYLRSRSYINIIGKLVNPNRVLWSGGIYMKESHTVTLSEAVSKQANGIVLVFSGYENGAVKDASWNTFYISKEEVNSIAGGRTFIMGINAGFSKIGAKYLYISDTTITGQESNTSTGTNSGITFNNIYFVLRYVIGV